MDNLNLNEGDLLSGFIYNRKLVEVHFPEFIEQEFDDLSLDIFPYYYLRLCTKN